MTIKGIDPKKTNSSKKKTQNKKTEAPNKKAEAPKKIRRRTRPGSKSKKTASTGSILYSLFISSIILVLLVLSIYTINYLISGDSSQKITEKAPKQITEKITTKNTEVPKNIISTKDTTKDTQAKTNTPQTLAPPTQKNTNSAANKNADSAAHNNSIDEWTERIDRSLSVAYAQLGIHAEDIHVNAETLQHFNINYKKQTVRLNIASGPPELVVGIIANIKKNLNLFALGAELNELEPQHLQININKVLTHDIYLQQGYKLNDFEDFGETPETVQISLDELMATLSKDKKGRLAIVIDDMGQSLEAMKALTDLSFPVSVAIWPHGPKRLESAKLAHDKGLDILVHMPMEPIRYPKFQPGPKALFKKMSREEIYATLQESLAKVPYAIGVNNHMGSRFTQWPEGVIEVVRAAAERSFFVLDSVTHPNSVLFSEALRFGVPAYKRHIFLDTEASLSFVLKQLELSEKVALHRGEAIAIGHPLAATLEALKIWQKRADSRVELVLIHQLSSQ